MEDTTILEVDTSNVQPVATDTNVATNTVADTNVGEPATVEQNSTVVEQATPMDSNVTYDNIKNTIDMQHEMNVFKNSGASMDNFLNNEYDYDKNEAGTYWVAGNINDVNTQMSFLNTIIREEMYDEMDLQKYYYDTTFATARAYAAQKDRETAYGFYRAAQEKALSEAQLTGWYMPAEGEYMLGQYNIAKEVLSNPDSDAKAINKANRISSTVEKWFNANQIGPKGIKCLNLMTHEENVRHNDIMAKLAEQAAAAAASGNDLNYKMRLFDIEEQEMGMGIDITGEGYIGHQPGEWASIGYYMDKGAKDVKEYIKEYPGVFNAYQSSIGYDNMKMLFGEEWQQAALAGQSERDKQIAKTAFDNTDSIIPWDDVTKLEGCKDKNGKQLAVLVGDDGELHIYNEDGDTIKSGTEIKDTRTNKKVTIEEFLKNSELYKDQKIDNKDYKINGEVIKVTKVDETLYSSTDEVNLNGATVSRDPDGKFIGPHNTFRDDDMIEVLEKKAKEGYQILTGLACEDGINSYYIMRKGNEYIQVEVNGKEKELTESQIDNLYRFEIDIEPVAGEKYVIGGIRDSGLIVEKKSNGKKTRDTSNNTDALSAGSVHVGYSNGNAVYSYTDANNKTMYYTVDAAKGSSRAHSSTHVTNEYSSSSIKTITVIDKNSIDFNENAEVKNRYSGETTGVSSTQSTTSSSSTNDDKFSLSPSNGSSAVSSVSFEPSKSEETKKVETKKYESKSSEDESALGDFLDIYHKEEDIKNRKANINQTGGNK